VPGHSPLLERAGAPLVTVNCTALAPPARIRALGHKRGAFTGAWRTSPASSSGRTAAPCSSTRSRHAARDAGQAPPRAADGRSSPWGRGHAQGSGARHRRTNRDLEKRSPSASSGRIFFYRFNTFTITLPPLATGPNIPVLAHHSFARPRPSQQARGRSPRRPSTSSSAIRARNLRELENIIERAVCWPRVARSRSLIFRSPAGAGAGDAPAGEGFLAGSRRTLALFERDAIGRLLAEARAMSRWRPGAPYHPPQSPSPHTEIPNQNKVFQE